MRLVRAVIFSSAFVLASSVVLAQPSPMETLECVIVQLEARIRYPGYNHIVHLTNACSVEAVCQVSTNVNPEVMTAVVPAGASVEVLTFMGSPAREFTARVECSTR